MVSKLAQALQRHRHTYHPVLPFDPSVHRLHRMDFSSANQELSLLHITQTAVLSAYIDQLLSRHQAHYGIGGYGENRVLYQRSSLFSQSGPARTIHLGTDIWAPAGTPVFAPLGGMVHSVGFHPAGGNYGGTLILQHQLDTLPFHTLYGHLSAADAARWAEGMYVVRGQQLGTLGTPKENGDWPPHLHFQIIEDMDGQEGHYPGVCAPAQQEYYLKNCPDPQLILSWQNTHTTG